MDNNTTNMESGNAKQMLAELLITKLQERLKLFPNEDDFGLYDRGLYDGYLNSLNIVTEECAKQLRQPDAVGSLPQFEFIHWLHENYIRGEQHGDVKWFDNNLAFLANTHVGEMDYIKNWDKGLTDEEVFKKYSGNDR